MKLGFSFSNLLGAVYKSGNLLFSPDGNSVLSPVGNRVSVFDLSNNKSYTLPMEHSHDIACMTLSPDGTLLFTVDVTGRALLSNIVQRVVVHHLSIKASHVHAVAFSPDSKYLAVASGSHIEVWSTPDTSVRQFAPFARHRVYTGHFDDVRSISWAPNSRWFVTGSEDATARLYSLHPIDKFRPVTFSGARDWIVGAFFSQDGQKIYTISRDAGVFVWSWTPSNKIRRKKHKTKTKLSSAVSDATTVASDSEYESDSDDSDSEQHSAAVVTTANRDNVITAVDQSKDIRTDTERAHDKTYARGKWSLSTRSYVRPTASTPSSGKDVLEPGSTSANIRGHQVTSVAFHPKTSLLVVGLSSGVFALYEMPGLQHIHTLSISLKQLSSVAINSTGEWLAFGAAGLGQLLVWEWQSETYVLKQQGHAHDMGSLAYSPDGQVLASGGDDAKVKLWNTATGFCYVTLAEHVAPITGLAWSSTGRAMVSASLDGTVRAWDLTRYRNFRTMTSPSPVQFSSVCMDPAGEVIVAGASDPWELYVWNLQTGKLLEVLTGHEGPISAVSWSPTTPFVASGSWDGSVRFWDVFRSSNTAVEVLKHGADVLTLAHRPDGDQLAVSAANGSITFWEPHEAQIMGTVEARRDLGAGRRVGGTRTAQSDPTGRAFTTLSYSPDGAALIAGGDTRWICVYSTSSFVLLHRIQLTHNKSLDGTTDFLSSAKLLSSGMTMEEIDDDSDAEDSREVAAARRNAAANALPGVQRGELASRNVRAIARTRSVSFAPTGRAWAAATSEGLLVYGLPQAAAFDPYELSIDVTPSNALAASAQGEHGKAVMISLKLGNAALTSRVMDVVSPSQLPAVVNYLPLPYIPRLLAALALRLDSNTPHIEAGLQWIRALLAVHGTWLKSNANEHRAVLRALQRALLTSSSELSALCNDNAALMSYLSSAPAPAQDVIAALPSTSDDAADGLADMETAGGDDLPGWGGGFSDEEEDGAANGGFGNDTNGTINGHEDSHSVSEQVIDQEPETPELETKSKSKGKKRSSSKTPSKSKSKKKRKSSN